MNPIRWLIDDIKWFFIIIKRIIKQEPLINPEKWKIVKKELKTITIKSFFKESGHWLLVILFAFVIGWLLASKYYQLQCNNFIVETYIIPQIYNITNAVTNINFTGLT
jgi:hypothetical protein